MKTHFRFIEVLLLLYLPAAVAQNPNIAKFPSAIVTDCDLGVAKDRSTSTLAADIDSDDLIITVQSGHGARFIGCEFLTIENEHLQIESIDGDAITICAGCRGLHETIAVSHSAVVAGNPTAVNGYWIADHLNQQNAELIAIQEQIGVNRSRIFKTDADNITEAETTSTFTPGAIKPSLRLACAPLPSTPGAAGSVACDSNDSNSLKIWNGTEWVSGGSGSGGGAGSANKKFERTGVNFSIDESDHLFDHDALLVAVYDYDTRDRIDQAIHVDATSPFAVRFVDDLPSTRHMLIVISGWGGPASSPHDMFSAIHSDTTGAASPVFGDMIYGNATPLWDKLPGNITATKKFLSQTGNGTVSAMPSWLELISTDLSDSSQLLRTTTPVTVPQGGTGATSLTGVLKGNGTAAISAVTGTATDCVLVDGTSAACGSGGGLNSIAEVDGSPSLSSVTALTFDQSDGFRVSGSSPNARVDLASIPDSIISHPGNIASTALAAAVTTTNLVTAVLAGTYEISGYLQTTTPSSGACTSTLTIGWTYNGSAKTATPLVSHDNAVDENYSQIPGGFILRATAASNITYALSRDGACTALVQDLYLVAAKIDGDSVPGTSYGVKPRSTTLAINNPATTYVNGAMQFKEMAAWDIVKVGCSTTAGTVDLQLDERAEATPNTAGTNVLTTALTCDSDSESTTSFVNAAIDADAPVAVVLSNFSSVGVVRIHVFYN